MDFKNFDGITIFKSNSKYLCDAILEANLHGVNLSEADLSWSNLSKANLSKANLHEADLSWSNLSKANLHGADLSWSNLHGVNLHGADLSKANLHGADLSRTDLHGANLSEADLSWSNLHGADLRGANVYRVEINGKIAANLRVFTGLYEYQVWSILFEDNSHWVRMGCLFKSLEEWEEIGIRNSNLMEFPNDNSDESEERVRAFEFAKMTVLSFKQR